MTVTINLVTTRERLLRDFPERADTIREGSGVMSADYAVDTGHLSKLGRFLAEHIDTTRFDDDASRCAILMHQTEFGLHVAEFARKLSEMTHVANRAAANEVMRRMREWMDRQQGVIDMYGPDIFERRIHEFRWPVYGSRAAEDAATPEAYFDVCARQIRKIGGVIIAAGLGNHRPPLSLQCTLNPAAEAMLDEYDRRRAARAG